MAAAPPQSGGQAIDLTLEDAVAVGSEDGGAGGRATALQLEQQLADVEDELSELESTLAALREREAQLRVRREQLARLLATERRAPRGDWARGSFAWDAQAAEALRGVFGLPGWRPLQRETINATMAGRDCLVLLPAGGGKSLLYQLPALLAGGLTLVVSPLLSLISDQLSSLAGKVTAYGLTSLTTKDEASAVLAALTAAASGPPPPPALLYVTPERVVSSKRLMSKLERLHQAGRLTRIAIDEAHCCSTWGNDFRPDYKKLCVLKQQFPGAPLIALTATATEQVCRDVCGILRIEGCERFAASIDRPCLAYEVRRKPPTPDAAAAELVDWIREHAPAGDGSGIVYCLTRKDCEATADTLRAAGIRAAPYHADMDPVERAAAQAAWTQGDVQVVCATLAFGMGISKPDVRFVLHSSISKSLENCYQESGRAGRDGKPARCVLWYRLSDVLRQAGVVCMDPSWQRCLMAVTRYAAAATRGACRRALLAAHFGEPPPPCKGTGMCDLCRRRCGASADAASSRHPGAGAAAAAARQQQQQQQEQQQEQGQGQGQEEEEDITAAVLLLLQTLQERKGSEKRATLTQLLDEAVRGARRARATHNGAADAAGERDVLEWAAEQALLAGLLGIEIGFTAYATTAYLVATHAGASFTATTGLQRLTAVRPAWLPARAAASTSVPRDAAWRSPAAAGGSAKRLCVQERRPGRGVQRRGASGAAAQPPLDGSSSDERGAGG